MNPRRLVGLVGSIQAATLAGRTSKAGPSTRKEEVDMAGLHFSWIRKTPFLVEHGGSLLGYQLGSCTISAGLYPHDLRLLDIENDALLVVPRDA